ncbi:g9307 [Coccomyxa elongata]
MTGRKARQRRSRCSVFPLLVHVIFQAAAGAHGSSRLNVSSAQAAEESTRVWVVPQGVPHHIYKTNVSAVEAWTPCHPDAYPPGAWVSKSQSSGLGSHLYGTAKRLG